MGTGQPLEDQGGQLVSSQEFFWVAIFESFTAIEVPQSDDSLINQAVAQRWNRSGTVDIKPNQRTEDVVKNIVSGCKEGGGIPADALLVSINVLPNILVHW